jgi:hypothetical protein
MLHRLDLPALIVCSLASVTACDGGSGDPVPLEQFGRRTGEVMCGKMADCCTAAEFMDEVGVANESACNALFGGFIDGFLTPVLIESVEAGRLVYHGERFAACLDAMAALSCADLQESMAEDLAFAGCEDPFEGLVVDGQQCANDVDCVSDYCRGDSVDFEGNRELGTCGHKPGAGEPCDGDECSGDAWCDRTSGTPTCRAPLPDSSECSVDDQCQSGHCLGTEQADGTCGTVAACDGT